MKQEENVQFRKKKVVSASFITKDRELTRPYVLRDCFNSELSITEMNGSKQAN